MSAKLRPLRNNIMFQFLDATGGAKGKFTDRRTESGIIIPTLDSAQKQSRWARVVAVGPDTEVKVGEFIFIEALMWSFGTEIDGEKYWKTDDTKVLLVTPDAQDTIDVTNP